MGVVIRTYAGDGAPTITFTITREDGSIVDLTGATVRLIIQDPATGLPTNNQSNSCVITSPSTGVCTYTWAVGGTDCPHTGIYRANIKIRYSTGAEETYAITINAEAPILFATIS